MKRLSIGMIFVLTLTLAGCVGTKQILATAETAVPPLYVLYINHTHLESDDLPYTNSSLQNINPQVAKNTIETIEAIAQRLEQVGLMGNWQTVYGTAQGLCEFEGAEHVFKRLQERGHTIGLHVHNHTDFVRDFEALSTACGIMPETASGLRIGLASLRPQQGAIRFTQVAQQMLDFGVKVGTINLNDTQFFQACTNQTGTPSTRDAMGYEMFPWHPDLDQRQICVDDPGQPFVLLEHVKMPAWTGGNAGNQPDVLNQSHFDTLQTLFDQALSYVEQTRPTQPAVWSFVTHPHEFMVGDRGENGPDMGALDALSDFLAYLDQQRIEGRVVFVTTNQIADLLTEQQSN